MGFRLASVDGRAALASGDDYYDLAELSGGVLGPDPMAALAAAGQLSDLSASLSGHTPTGKLADVSLGPPVPSPQKSFGIGLNYQAHADEGGIDVPTNPLVFTKFPSCIVGPTADVELRGATQGKFLQDLDVITTTIDGIGTIVNRCVRVSDYQVDPA